MSLIGDRKRLAFEVVPVTPSWDRRYAPEQAAWAGLALWVGGENLCRHVVAESAQVEDYVFIPLAPLADWLVRSFPAIAFEERPKFFPITRSLHTDVDRWAALRPPREMADDDWIDERERWWCSHFVRAGADGAILPDLALSRDDEELVISWRNRSRPRSGIAFISTAGSSAMSWRPATATIASFVAHVAGWLRTAGHRDTYEWASSDDPLEQSLRSADASLAYFVGQSISHLMAVLGASEGDRLEKVLGLGASWADPAESVECQVLRDLSPTITKDFGAALIEVGHQARAGSGDRNERWLSRRALVAEAVRPALTAEAGGQLAAEELRRSMKLDGAPISNAADLLADAGIMMYRDEQGAPDEMIVAAHEHSAPAVRTFESMRTRTEWGHRFEACRGLGHALCDPIRAGSLGAGSGPYARGNRRRRSGAFAAELLLPQAAIARLSEGRLDVLAEPVRFEGLLEEYGVGARAAAYQLWNRGWLSSSALRDELIDGFAAR